TSTAPPAICAPSTPGPQPPNAFGSIWGKSKPGPNDDHEPSSQALMDTRLDSLTLLMTRARTEHAGWWAETQFAPTTGAFWGVGYRLHVDLAAAAGGDPSGAPQFAGLTAMGLDVLTTGNEFPYHLESECFDGSTPAGASPAESLAAALRAPPHPVALSSGLLIYMSPATSWGQPGNDDPAAPDSHHRQTLGELMACIESRVAHAEAPSVDVVRYDGQVFVYSGTTHLHNMLEGDPVQVAGFDAPVPSGIAELSSHIDVMSEVMAEHNATPGRAAKVTVAFETLAQIEASRDASASYGFVLKPSGP
ncbi:MAG: hypothetical protein QF464_09755, partial [Myxococcota bacterium]|nr:hypothetical protein [Myxococcota bacterium]